MELSLLAKFARPHGSLVRSDLVPARLTRSAWGRLHASGVLRSLQPGVSAFATNPGSTLLSIEAAVMAAGPTALTGGPSSAWLWGAEGATPTRPVHLVVPSRGHSPQLRDVAVHRPTDLVDVSRLMRQRLPTTNPLHALLGVAAWTPESTSTVMEELIVGGLMGIGAARAVVRRHAKSGVPGIVALREACDSWVLGERPPDSLLEVRLGGLLAASVLPPALFQYRIGRLRVDYAWPELLAALECDGWEHHGRTRAKFEGERERDAELGGEGWVVWRYSWRQIVQRPGWVISTLTKRIATRASQLGLPSP